jgi:type IV secretion system protein VirB9
MSLECDAVNTIREGVEPLNRTYIASAVRVLLTAILLMPLMVAAEINPASSQFDPRVRVIDYNPLDVVKLTTYYGVSTHVQFDAEESIQDIAIGDEAAWHISPRANHLFLKPRASKADTNLTVLTNKRVYHFALVVETRTRKTAAKWNAPELVYTLHFRYPHSEAEKKTAQRSSRLQMAREIARDEVTRMQAETLKIKLAEASYTDKATGADKAKHAAAIKGPAGTGDNFDYWVAGSDEISPTAARDDGRFTYLTFSNNRDMPAVYSANDEGEEALINTNVEGNTIVVHRVVSRLILRKGDMVACIRNGAFDWDSGKDNALGTISPEVERTVREPR